MSDFLEFIQKYKNKKIAIGTHKNADLDGICSAYVLSFIFPYSSILVPDEISRIAQNFVQDAKIKVNKFKEKNKNEFEGLIVVDCTSFSMMNEAKEWKILCCIDHHQQTEKQEIKGELNIIHETSPSTCQILSVLLPNINEKMAFALAIGMISDSARFKNADVQMFEQLVKLLQICKKTYQEILMYAEPEYETDEKIAILELFKRTNIIICNNLVIATVIVSNNESRASSALSEFADIVFAATWKNKEKETQISSRARKHVSIKLNEVMYKIGNKFSGTGGGHFKAAGASAKEKPEIVLKECVDTVIEMLDLVERI